MYSPAWRTLTRLTEGGELLAIAQGLDDMEAADAGLAIVIGEGSRHAR